MPITTVYEVSADMVRKGDVIEGLGEVTSRRQLSVNIEFTFAEGEKKRMNRDKFVKVLRSEPTRDEQVEATWEGLKAAVDRLRDRAVAESTADITTTFVDKLQSNPLYAMQWNAEDLIVAEHTKGLWFELNRCFTRTLDEMHDFIDEAVVLQLVMTLKQFLGQLKERQLEWYPNRSTSPMSNLIEECKFNALRKFNQWNHDVTAVLHFERRLTELTEMH